ncbi:N-alpha-acetyltransferase 25, NatB auxiliary subunit [Chamberlinius hualienensis]
MAARSHVDASVNERRLRPIYDCLDNGNNKKAVQEADKVLKKQKDFQCAKVLKALALLRLGRQEDANKYLQQVHSEVPTDDATLQAMTICYRELHKLDMIAEIYDLASRKDPQNEELLTHLFMAYVRLGQYKKQQQVAMNLYKLKSKNPYYFWGIMSIVMQAHVASADIAQKMLLPLAERMTVKFVNENKIDAEAEVQLYLMILEQQRKYEEALQVLSGPLGNKLTSFTNFKSIKRASLLAKLQRWPEVNVAYKNLFLQSPDSWAFYVEYLSSTMKMMSNGYQPNNSNGDSGADYTLEMAEAALRDVIDRENAKSNSYRAPSLAYIKLACLARETQNSTSFQDADTLVNLMKKYFHKYGDKPCCFLDLQNFLPSLTDLEKFELIDSVNASLVDDDQINAAADAKQMQRHLFYIELCQFYGIQEKLNLTEKLKFCQNLILRYQQGQEFGVDLASTDFRSNDVYCVLASHNLLNIYQDNGDFCVFKRILSILEGALKQSPSSYQMKFLLIKLYSKIGAIGPIYSLYENMDIKHIQQDVLGYLIVPQLVAFGHFSQACIVYGNMLKFYTANHKDTVDHLITSYKFGSFTKIQEFVDFRERLNNSLQYACVTVERMIQDLIFEITSHQTTEQIIMYMEIDPEKDKTVFEDLVDNRDLNIMASWEPNFRANMDEVKRATFEAELEWLKVRNLLVRCIGAAHSLSRHCTGAEESHDVNCCGSVENGSQKLPQDILKDLVQQLRDLIDCCKRDPLQLPTNLAYRLPESRIVAHIRGGYSRPVLELFELLLQLPLALESNDTSAVTKCESLIKTSIPKEIQECVSRIDGLLSVEKFSILTKVGDILENLVNIAEMLSFSVILLGFCHVILKPATGSAAKKNRKKRGNQVQLPSVIELYNELVSELEKMIQSLNDSINALKIESLTVEFSSVTLDNIFDEEEQSKLSSEIPVKICKSYQQSLTEIGDLLQCKLKYLASLRL